MAAAALLGGFLVALAPRVAPAAPPSPASGSAVVHRVNLTGTVDPLAARYVTRAIRRAEGAGADGVLLQLDTPGGLVSSMRDIVRAVAAARIPVVCWVGPTGSRAASAGAIILLGCPVAAMAPGTNTGAAHPVGISGEILSEKVTNDAAAYARSLAERSGRNADWAERAVRASVSASAQEALGLHVIDLVAPDVPSLFAALEGRAVPTASGEVTLHLRGAQLVSERMTLTERVLHGLVAPDLAFLFFMLGLGGLVFEVIHPGLNLPGLIGLLLLVGAFVMFGMLPVNVAGLVLLAASVGFFLLDLHVAGHGLPTVAGIVTLILGGVFLFDASVPGVRVSRPLLGATALGMAGFFFFVVRAAMAARRLPVRTLADSLIGAEATVVRDLAPTGVVRAGGESWTARVEGGEAIPAGTPVRVVARHGLVLDVVPLAPLEVAE
jgi:membrane-bound serine protease (ClpP class)